jgi:integrase
VLGVVGAVVNYAADELEWLGHGIKVPLLEVPETEKPWATREKALKLISLLPKHQIPMVIFALEVGWRRSNVTHLCWEQIDMERRFAWVTPEDAKAGKGIPTPLTDTAMEVLEAQRGKDGTWVFPYRGEPVEQTSTRAYRAARDRAGLPPTFTWHALRHTWASWHIQDGTRKEIIRELGGWRTDRMVIHYAHLGADHLREHVEKRTAVAADIARAALARAGHRNDHSGKITAEPKDSKSLTQQQSGNSSVGRAQPCQSGRPATPPAESNT